MSSAQNIYLLSGLTANEYMFKNLIFPDGFTIKFLPWLQNDTNDTLETYAQKLIDTYNVKEGQKILGLSFGGIMASEIQKLCPQEKIIIVSSVSHNNQMPPYYQSHLLFELFKPFLKGKNTLPDSVLKWPFEPIDYQDFCEVKKNIETSNVDHLLWVLEQLSLWEHASKHSNLIQIHGSIDRIFPPNYVNCDYKIKGGGHLMLLNKAAQINPILAKVLA